LKEIERWKDKRDGKTRKKIKQPSRRPSGNETILEIGSARARSQSVENWL